MAEHNAVVGIYTTHTEAEAAVKALQQSGFNMQKLSIVGKDYHTEEHVIGYYTTGDRMQVWGKRGAFWGGFWGMLFGSGFFFIPGIGPLLVFGPLVSWIIGALEGAVVGGGLSALGAGLYSLGIPKDSIVEYETALKSDQFLVMAYGTGEEAAQAQRLLEAAGAAQVAAYRATIPRETLAHEAFAHGNACLVAGRFAEAIAAFHQARELNPKHPYVAARLAEVERCSRRREPHRPSTLPSNPPPAGHRCWRTPHHYVITCRMEQRTQAAEPAGAPSGCPHLFALAERERLLYSATVRRSPVGAVRHALLVW